MLRPVNAILAGAAVLAGAAMAHPMVAYDKAWLFAAGAAACITAFGNVINDLRDARLDQEAHPHRPLPSGDVTRRAAWVLAVVFLVVGLGAAAWIGWQTLLFAAANATLLVAYEWRLKQWGLPGNVVVSALTGSVFLFGAVATARAWANADLVWAAAGMAFFVNLAREVAKDLQDVVADRPWRSTFPMQAGTRVAGWSAASSGVLAILCSIPFLEPARLTADCGTMGWIVPVLVVAANVVVLGGSVLCLRYPARAQLTLKAGMAVALLAFLVAPLFSGFSCP